MMMPVTVRTWVWLSHGCDGDKSPLLNNDDDDGGGGGGNGSGGSTRANFHHKRTSQQAPEHILVSEPP